jgi:hypothetical protein
MDTTSRKTRTAKLSKSTSPLPSKDVNKEPYKLSSPKIVRKNASPVNPVKTVSPIEIKVTPPRRIRGEKRNVLSMLNKMEITVLQIVTLENETYLICVTPLGTIIMVSINDTDDIDQSNYEPIDSKLIQESKLLSTSVIASVEDFYNKIHGNNCIIVCKNHGCIFSKTTSGKTIFKYLEFDNVNYPFFSQTDVTLYPLVSIDEIYSNTSSKYLEILEHLLDLSNKSYTHLLDLKNKILESDIKFLETLSGNLRFLKDKNLVFMDSTLIEQNSLNDIGKEILLSRLNGESLSPSDNKQWKHHQSKLLELNNNKNLISRDPESFEEFKMVMGQVDRELFSHVTSSYVRCLKTIENELNIDIRLPSCWDLENSLDLVSDKLKENPAITTENLAIVVNSNIAKNKQNNLGERDVVYQSFIQNYLH